MSPIKSYKVVFVGFMVISLSAVFAADKESRLTYYQQEIKPKETGVYSHDGDIYVHVRLPYKSGERSDVKRMEAKRQIQELLRNWAISYAEARQREKAPESDGVKFTKRIVGKYYPQWNYGAWMFSGQTQLPVPDTSNGYYVSGLIASEAEVIEQIPDGFYQQGSLEDLFKGVRLVVRANVARAPDKFFKECGVVDLPGGGTPADAEVMSETKFLDGRIAQYLDESQLAGKMRAAMIKLETPVMSEAKDVVLGPESSESKETVNFVTNVVDNAVCMTNVVRRAQEVSEIKKTGYSEGAQVTETTFASDEYEVVETITRTTVITRKRIARNVRKSVVGTPTFERVFLNGFTNGVSAVDTTRFGEIALGRISENASKKGGLLRSALQENPYDKTLWNEYGQWFSETNDLIAAVICFRRAIELDAKYYVALLNLGKAYRKIGCDRLCIGLAFVVRGLSDDELVISEAESLLTEK